MAKQGASNASSTAKNSFLPTRMCQCPRLPAPFHSESHHSAAIMHQQASGTYFVVKGSSTHSVQEHPGESIKSLFLSIHTAHYVLFPKGNCQHHKHQPGWDLRAGRRHFKCSITTHPLCFWSPLWNKYGQNKCHAVAGEAIIFLGGMS